MSYLERESWDGSSVRRGRTSACGTRDIGAAGWGFRSADYAWQTSWLSRSLLHGCICRWRDGRVNCKSTWCARVSGRQDNGFTLEEERLVRSEVPEDWLRGLQSYTLRWVERHRDQWTAFGGATAGGEHVPANETQA